jgi:NADPH:quinone reductase-like Zn-dependent oxidoreductase
MKVVRLADSGAGTVLVDANAPQPRPSRGDLVIRVCAARVTPTELIWYPSTHNKTGEKRTGAVPGHEFSGVIAEAGENAGSANIGHAVFGVNDWFSDGATAEYCVAHCSAVGRNLAV